MMSETWDRKPVAPNNSGDEKKSERAAAKEWSLIEKVVLTHSTEIKRTRRWGILFKSLTFIYLFALLYFIFIANGTGPRAPVATGGHVAVVEMQGQIGENLDISMETIRRPLMNAFSHPDTQAVVLAINSPGGSPVQSQLIFDHIRTLKAQYPDVPVYAVISELGASGAYFIAAAADEIYASGSSLVGSIGVVAGGFGFTEAMERLGVERRLYTAGESKGFLDMFSPENPEELAHWQTVLDDVHAQFIAAVRTGRGDRLAEDDELFTGLMWSGSQAVDKGLTDGIESVYSLSARLGIDELLRFEPEREPWRRLLEDFGLAVGRGAVSVLSSERPLELR